MIEQHQHTTATTRDIVYKRFLIPLEKEVAQYSAFLADYEKMLNTYGQFLENLPEHNREITWTFKTLQLKRELFAHLASLKHTFAVQDFDEKFFAFFKSMDIFLATLEEEIELEQSPNRYKLNINDKFPARSMKIAKIFMYKISTLPNGIANIFRKEKKRAGRWNHDIPLRNLAELHLKYEMALVLHPLYHEYFNIINQSIGDLEKRSNQAADLKPIFDTQSTPPSAAVKLDVNEYQKTIAATQFQIQAFLKHLRTDIDKIVNHQFNRYQIKFEKVGTIEMLGFWYQGFFLQRKKNEVSEQFKYVEARWIRSMEVLFDTWLFRLELKIVDYVALEQFLQTELTYCQRIYEHIIKELDLVKDFILETKEEICSIDEEDLQKLRSKLEKVRQKVYSRLSDEIIPKTMDFIVNQDLPNLVNHLESSVTRQVGKLSDSRTISNKTKPPLPISEMIKETIYPKALVNFEAYPTFKKSIGEVRKTIFQELNDIQEFVKSVTKIVDFALDSAIVATEPTNKETNAHKVAEEGLKRALLKVEEVHNELGQLYAPVSNQLRQAVGIYRNAVISLIDPQNLSKLSNRITASLAMQPTRQLKNKFKSWLFIGLPAAWLFLTGKWKELRKLYADFRVQMGIDTAPEIKATEITDYFAESKTAASKLPYVYQRLFKLGPAFDENLVIERTKEDKVLDKAWANWCRGTFAPIAIVGERGAGISTLINTFLNKNCLNYKVTRIELKKMLIDEQALLTFICSKIEQPEIETFEQLVSFLLSEEHKQVIVLENIQLLFIKKVNGFGAIRALFELISKTNSKVLWQTSCTLYAWEYLHKTINITDFHAYIVRLGDLNDEEMVEAILRRHRISGYSVEYVPTKKIETKRFKRSNHIEQQKNLEKEYFSRLNQFAQSNLSLAIVYWLRSAQNVEGNTIYIGIQDVDFSFINSLSNPKIFTLYEVIIHGSITPLQLAAIRNYPLAKAELELMALRDDGFLFCGDGNYELNLLLYRPVVRLLKSKNMIH